MSPPYPVLHYCDVWEPTENIDPDGSVETPTYHLSQSNLEASFQSRNRGQRIFAGAVDVTEAGVKLFLYGTKQEPSGRALYVHAAEGIIYRSDGKPQWKETPVSAGHFEADLTEERTPPDEVSAFYPE